MDGVLGSDESTHWAFWGNLKFFLERQAGAMWPTLPHLWQVADLNLHSAGECFPRPHLPQGLATGVGASTTSTGVERDGPPAPLAPLTVLLPLPCPGRFQWSPMSTSLSLTTNTFCVFSLAIVGCIELLRGRNRTCSDWPLGADRPFGADRPGSQRSTHFTSDFDDKSEYTPR